MFVCLLLASGMLALEREENTFERLRRGLVPVSALLAEKALLAALCAALLASRCSPGSRIFVPLDWGRAGLWLLALAGGALAFATLGVALGAARARRARRVAAGAAGLAAAGVPGARAAGHGRRRPLRRDPRDLAVFPFKPGSRRSTPPSTPRLVSRARGLARRRPLEPRRLGRARPSRRAGRRLRRARARRPARAEPPRRRRRAATIGGDGLSRHAPAAAAAHRRAARPRARDRARARRA